MLKVLPISSIKNVQQKLKLVFINWVHIKNKINYRENNILIFSSLAIKATLICTILPSSPKDIWFWNHSVIPQNRQMFSVIFSKLTLQNTEKITEVLFPHYFACILLFIERLKTSGTSSWAIKSWFCMLAASLKTKALKQSAVIFL